MPSDTKEFLLEIGVEEIPASMIEPALADLKRLLEEGFSRSRLSGDTTAALEMYSTPRRLVAYCASLPARQPDSAEMVQGPPKRVAFDGDGKPTAAALSFASKMDTKVEKLQTVSTPKGEYLAFKKKERGKPAVEILRELIPQAVQGISFPRSMYWESKAGPYFVRPIRSLLALFGGRVIPCSIGEVRAGNWTFGHRRLGKPRVRVTDFANYREALAKNFVLLDAGERRARILDNIEALLASDNGFRIKQNLELLNTLVYLTEYPTPLMGSFDPGYLSLPQEVLITVMRGHQKYFSVEQPDGLLAPRFIAVMNLDGDSKGAIRHGNERVLRARFNDARFFWETDGKLRLEERLDLLRSVTFQSRLGSYYDKASRMAELTALLVSELPSDVAQTVSLPEVQKAAKLAKCDLTTELVKEFTELQGVIGGLYAEREGLPKEIATAIYDQYKPQSMDDPSPRTLQGALVSLADRMDTLVGCFGVGLAPSGSKDPFALRRAAQGVIRILLDHRLPLTIASLLRRTEEVYSSHQPEGHTDWDALNRLPEFLIDRLRYYARDVRGFAYDEVNAVLEAGAQRESVPVLLNTIAAVSRIRPTENFEPLAVAFKRIKNILQQARKTQAFEPEELDTDLFEPGPEAQLHQRYMDVSAEVARHKAAGNYVAALEAIASLRPDVDLFFDKILVMAPDAKVRQNRLSLLQKLLSEFSTIADFSEIVVSDKTEPRP
ncbi:MAG: glycine--tRNA ligase subunit beta [Acidobacteria bacterium]|nr:glycine--tRNA ligase subunit beta [Acidobacteriota bacterium]